MSDPAPFPAAAVRITQILVAAMLGGMLAFSAVAAAIGPKSSPSPDTARTLLLVAAGILLVTSILGTAVIPRAFAAQARARLRGAQPEDMPAIAYPLYQTSCILRTAMLEGPGLLGAFIVLTHGSTLALAIPAAAAAILILTFPTNDRFARFIEQATGARRA